MNQKTIRYPVSIQGVGLHTGDTCTIKLSPSSPNTGISFYLATGQILYSDIKNVTNPVLSTNLGNDVCSVSTVEHLMACLHVLGITNIKVTVTGTEIPILDGSAKPFWNILLAAEIQPQKEDVVFKRISEPYEYSSGNSYVYAEPYDKLEIHMKIQFDHPKIGVQKIVYEMYHNYWEEHYIQEFERCIVNARTFGILSQIEKARENGLIKGGSMNNAIVLDDEEILNPPLRMDNEFVTHKLIDFLGDIYLSGPVLGFFDVCCTSHQFNNQIIRSIFQ